MDDGTAGREVGVWSWAACGPAPIPESLRVCTGALPTQLSHNILSGRLEQGPAS